MVGRRVFLALAVCMIGLAGPWSARADSAQAEQLIRAMADEAIAQLTDPNLPVDEQDKRFRSIMRNYVAFETIARWVLGGRYWKAANEAQQARYLGLFEDLMVATYAYRFQDYSGEKLEIASVRVIDETQTLVQTVLNRPGADQPLRIDWRVRDTEGKQRVIDIMVEGLSMAQTQRAEFSSVMRDNGGDLDKLLNDLEARLAKAREDRATTMASAKKS